MDLEIVRVDAASRWDAALARVEGGDVYYRREYVQALARRGEGEPLLIATADGVLVTLMRRIDDGDARDLISPYGYGGPLLVRATEACATAFLAAWSRAAAELGAVSEFVRFHPVLETHVPFRHALDLRPLSQTVIVDLERPLGDGLSEMWTRNLRIAARKGVVVEDAPPDGLARFARLYRDTMLRHGASSYYLFEDSYFEELVAGLGDDAWIAIAVREGVDVAAGLALRHGPYLHYHLGGSSYEHRDCRPMNALLYHFAERGQAHGLRTYHVGGGLKADDNLFQFKAGLSPRRGEFCVGRRIHDPAIYETLAAARRARGPIDEGFFPAYRAPPPRG